MVKLDPLIWLPSSSVKVEKYLVKHMTAVLTVVDALIKDESNSCQEDNTGKLVDAVILLANTNSEVNLHWRGRLKPELHLSYYHLCSPSNTITSPIFGDDLLKNVKDIAEANEISSTIHGRRRLAGKGRGSLQAPTAALLTGQISTMHPGQKTTIAPPSQTGGKWSRRGSSNNRRNVNKETLIYITT